MLVRLENEERGGSNTVQPSMFTQLATPLPVSIEGKGKGLALAVIDYGPEHNLIWVTALDDSGEVWCAPNPLVRMRANWTMGRAPEPEAAAG